MLRISALVLASVVVVSVHIGTRASDEREPATLLNAIEVVLDERGTVVTFAANGRLEASSIHETEQWPPRLVIDLPDVTPGVPSSTRVDVGPVEGIRVATHGRSSPVTRVVLDLLSSASYEVERWAEKGDGLRIIFPSPTKAVGETSPVGQADVNRRAAVSAWASARPRAHVIPAKAVFGAPRPSSLVPTLPMRLETRKPEASLEVPLAAGKAVPPEAAPLPLDDIDLVGLQTLNVGELVDPEALSIPAYLVLGNRTVSSEPGATSPTHGHRATQFQRVSSGEQRQYTGDPVSMDFQNAPLRAVLRTLAEISGLNIVIDPQVEGTVDVALTEVPWDQALDIILRSNQLGYLVDETVVRIAPLSVLAAEEDQRRLLVEAQELSGDLVVMTRTLSYARAEEVSALIKQSVLSKRGDLQVDPRTNTLIVRDLEDRLGGVDDLLDTLDRAEPQVEIEARIVQASKDFSRSIGVNWGLTGRVAPDLGNTTPLTFPNRGGISGRLGQQGPGAGEQPGDPRASDLEAVGTAVNLPAAAASSAIGVTLGAVDGALNLDVVLSAAEGDGQIRLLSHPRVTTPNNVQAEIIQGDQIPIQIVSNNTVTVTFQDAALSLRVTPQITAADTVIMQIEIDNDFADFGREINGIPPIVTQRASTTVQVANGDTTVIGGIFESESSRQNNRVPMLHRIPLLGWLFKSEAERESSEELLIFLTPRVIR